MTARSAVEVYRTNIPGTSQFRHVLILLQKNMPHSQISFDAEDCDRVIRFEGNFAYLHLLPQVVRSVGYECEVLE